MGKQMLDAESDVKEKKAKYSDLREIWENQKSMPEIYTVPPVQPTKKKINQLNDEQLKQFFEKGFVLVKDFFPPGRLDVVRDAVNDLVDTMANKLYDAGKIKNKHEDKGFNERLIYLEEEFKGTAVLMHKQRTLPEAFQKLWSDERLLNVAEQLVGPEVAGHPVWNLRCKTPQNEQATVPWHQDNAYLHPCSLETLQLTAWIPLVNATKKNGCMQVASGGHHLGKTATHTCCAGGTWYVQLDEEDMVKELGVDMDKDIVTCEVPYGGVLFLQNCIPHHSLENYSDHIRWSLDLRWQKPDTDNGFYGLDNNILMRSSKNPNLKIDWTDAVEVEENRKKQRVEQNKEHEEFMPEVTGPWMHRWELVHHNNHTKLLTEDKNAWYKA